MTKVVAVSLIAILLAGASSALADDVFPAPWRGEWSTTYQFWQFGTPDTGAQGGVTPDGPGELIEGQPGQPYIQPGYLPSTRLWVYPDGDWIDQDATSPRQGIWPLSGSIDVVVDNHDPVNPDKLLWVQLTWRSTGSGNGMPVITPDDMLPDFTTGPVRIEYEQAWGDGWTTTLFAWEIHPNPQDEWFTISGDIDVDQLVIDTWCIPEPATLSLLALGGLAVIRRRRK